MIQFTREGTKVRIEISSNALSKSFLFYHECGQDHFASLMDDSYQERMSQSLERIRREAYNQGWKDAKAKVKKESWFSGWW